MIVYSIWIMKNHWTFHDSLFTHHDTDNDNDNDTEREDELVMILRIILQTFNLLLLTHAQNSVDNTFEKVYYLRDFLSCLYTEFAKIHLLKKIEFI